MVNCNVSSLHDLQKTRIERDEDNVKKVLQMIETTWKNPFKDQSLANISTSTGLLNAHEKYSISSLLIIDWIQ